MRVFFSSEKLEYFNGVKLIQVIVILEQNNP